MYKSISYLLGLCVLVGSAMADTGSSRPNYVSDAMRSGDLVEINSRTYAKSHGVSVDEAKRRLVIQGELDPLLAGLQEKYKGAVAGIFIEHDPVYKIVVRLTGKGGSIRKLYRTSVGDLPVELRFGSAHSRQELADSIKDGYVALKALLPDLEGVGVDERSGEVVAFTYSPNGEIAALDALQADVARVLRVPVRIN